MCDGCFDLEIVEDENMASVKNTLYRVTMGDRMLDIAARILGNNNTIRESCGPRGSTDYARVSKGLNNGSRCNQGARPGVIFRAQRRTAAVLTMKARVEGENKGCCRLESYLR